MRSPFDGLSLFVRRFFSNRSAEPPTPTIVGQGRGVVESFKRYLNARLALALAEADELTRRLKGLLVIAGLALVLAIMLALTLEAGLFGLLVVSLGWSWPLAAFALAGAHLVALIVLGLILARRARFQAFPLSRGLSKAGSDRAAVAIEPARRESAAPSSPESASR